jgi:hypothetical protein
MGLDASAQLIIGVPIEKKGRIVEVTKYNVDTGEPYTQLTKEYFYVYRGTDIEIPFEDETGEDLGEYFVCCDYENENTYFLGIEVASTYSHRSNDELWVEVTRHDDDDLEGLKKFLGEMNYVGELKYYLLQNLSY